MGGGLLRLGCLCFILYKYSSDDVDVYSLQLLIDDVDVGRSQSWEGADVM